MLAPIAEELAQVTRVGKAELNLKGPLSTDGQLWSGGAIRASRPHPRASVPPRSLRVLGNGWIGATAVSEDAPQPRSCRGDRTGEPRETLAWGEGFHQQQGQRPEHSFLEKSECPGLFWLHSVIVIKGVGRTLPDHSPP